MIKKCIYCKKSFETKREDAKFCGYQCYWKWLKKHQKENSKKISEWTKQGMAKLEVIEKMRLAKLGNPRAGNPKNWKLSKKARKKLSKNNKGKHHSPKTEFKKGLIPWNKGLKGTIKANSGSFKKGQTAGKNNIKWKGGITPENEKIRKNIKYYNWRRRVYARDNWICQKCEVKNGNGKAIILHSHHIKNFADYPELQFKTNNGITFCKKCHEEFHKIYGIKNNNEKQIKEFLCNPNPQLLKEKS